MRGFLLRHGVSGDGHEGKDAFSPDLAKKRRPCRRSSSFRLGHWYGSMELVFGPTQDRACL